MKRGLWIRPEAEADLSEAYIWYEHKVQDLGDRFLDEVERIYGFITDNPSIYLEIEQGVHRAVVRRFPYSIYYFFSDELVTVVAVLHQSRHPETWKYRM